MDSEFIPLSVPNIKGNELSYVTEAIESEWVSTAGPYVEQFEHKIAEYVHAKGAVACQNGTSGLHVSLMLMGVTREDEVIVPALTFIAAVNPVKYIGAEPVFMDCDDYLCLDPVSLKRFCEEECSFDGEKLLDKKTNRHVKAVVVVHVFGNMADMEAIMDIANTYHLKVVEDATEAIGTYYTEGRYKGSFAGTIGTIGVYSFNGNKIMTTGGGGMIVSQNEELLKKAKHLTTQAKSDELYYLHDEVGFNYRMTNIQAALGVAQLEQLETFIETKQNNYEEYVKRVEGIDGLRMLPVREGVRSNHWFYALYCDGYQLDRDSMIKHLSSHKIQSRPIWGLINEQKPYQDARAYEIIKAYTYCQHVVNVPCSTNLTREQVKRVMDVIEAC